MTRTWLRRLWVGACGSCVVVGVLVFPHAGRFLVASDAFTYADTAVILSGVPVTRALAARDLYLQHRVGQILVIPEPQSPVEGELVRLGLLDPHLPPWPERILAASGVPRSTIAFLPEPINGTIVEANAVRDFLGGTVPKRMVLITSPQASRRARFIFRQVFRKAGVEVLSYPTPYDVFEADRWWSQPRNALYVVMEYQKFLVNALQLALGAARVKGARSDGHS